MKYVLMLSLLISCSSKPPKLSDEAKNVEVVTNKPTNCNVVGKIVGIDEAGSKELALNRALNEAAKLGATTLHVNQEVPNGKKMSVYATAYECN